ncbi:hypothetical protein [Kitasatospora sp. SolWspMP-SS2h]|uniref:hypothetical protein n=1 Tax=Kitasatospora sp. SolWspMP-SS2h TaxID=1305729 RepID=UPI000DBA67D6|nr:hypothetical protein [Kitasatospora sp. SolWspMP-SS2h]
MQTIMAVALEGAAWADTPGSPIATVSAVSAKGMEESLGVCGMSLPFATTFIDACDRTSQRKELPAASGRSTGKRQRFPDLQKN